MFKKIVAVAALFPVVALAHAEKGLSRIDLEDPVAPIVQTSTAQTARVQSNTINPRVRELDAEKGGATNLGKVEDLGRIAHSEHLGVPAIESIMQTQAPAVRTKEIIRLANDVRLQSMDSKKGGSSKVDAI